MSLIVVTVVKDDFQNLRVTAASVQAQSTKVDWLLVTPFDGSTTHAYCQELQTDNVAKDVIEDHGGGIYPAMNLVLSKISKDDWVWFLNAGDVFAERNCYWTISTLIAKNQSRWVYGSHTLANVNGRILGDWEAPEKFQVKRQLFAKKHICHQATIFKNELLLELGGFNTKYEIAADWDLMVRASKLDAGERVAQSLCIFRLGGLSSVNRQKSNRELFMIRLEHLHKRFLLKSIIWFCYRSIRNQLVLAAEKSFPNFTDTLRRIKFHLRKTLNCVIKKLQK